jgi:hypothetical protein
MGIAGGQRKDHHTIDMILTSRHPDKCVCGFVYFAGGGGGGRRSGGGAWTRFLLV